MTKSTITRERLEELAAGQSGFNLRIATLEESQQLASMALAALDSEPHTDDELSNLLRYSQEATCHSDPNYYCEFQRLATPGLIAGIIRELQERRKADSEPVQNHIGSKNSLDAIVSFIKSKSNPTVKCYEEVSEQLFKDNCHGIHSHVIEYILKLGEELEDLRAEQAEMQPAPGATAESISFDEWSRKCALQITLCYPGFREKAKYIWDSARETQHVAPALFDDVSIFEAAIEECKTCDSIDEHAWNHGVLVVMAKYESCRAARLQAQPQNAPQNIPEIIPDCWCCACRPVVLNDMRFVVCPDCRNKRCPRANDHRNACTGSNEPGQEGSAHPDTPQEVKGE